MPHFEDEHAGGFLVPVEAQGRAEAGLAHVVYLEAADVARAELLHVEQVHEMFHVLHAVEVPVDVDVAVAHGEFARRGILVQAGDFARALDRHRFGAQVARQPVQLQQVGGAARVHVDGGPQGAGEAERMPPGRFERHAAFGEELVDARHPGADLQGSVVAGVFGHFDDDAREHPRLVQGGHGRIAEAAFLGVLGGRLQDEAAHLRQRGLAPEVGEVGIDVEPVIADDGRHGND